jgi:outer membrane receptor for ferrienterochelin and colicins
MKLLQILFWLGLASHAFSQNIKGIVLEYSPKGEYVPLEGAIAFWVGSDVAAETDSLGSFTLPIIEGYHMLLVKYDSLTSDTIHVHGNDLVKIIIKTATRLEDVIITDKQSSKFLNLESITNMQTMGSAELLKAACCNLSESFETNPSIDVSYADALSGAKSIQMLGLAGKYSNIISENLPSVRGLNIANGMNFIPGTWLQSIQVTKGIGSASSGFEGIGGEINTELKKPDGKEKFLFNLYANDMGRTELNLNHKLNMGKNWSQYSMYHVNFMPTKQDINNDNYLNIPRGLQGNMAHRWKYQNTNGWIAQLGIQVMADSRLGGHKNYQRNTVHDSNSVYGFEQNVRRAELWGKLGYVFPRKKYKSIGLLAKTYVHRQNDRYGLNTYAGDEEYAYINGIYQSVIKTSIHKYRVGVSAFYNNYKENVFTKNYQRTELSTGAFAEYTFSKLRFSAVASLRGDYHNLVGFMFNPRLHLKYNLGTNTVLRVSGGKGQRLANIFAENSRYLFSTRTWNIAQGDNKLPYGLQQEIAWNYGVNLSHEWKINQRKRNFAIDFYRTDFVQQVVIDVDQNRDQVNIYNLNGKSFSNNAQIELSQNFGKTLEIRTAYRYVDAQTTLHGVLLQNPFVAKHRAFANVALASKNRHWKVDYTLNWVGKKRTPILVGKSNEVYLPNESSYSPWYFQHNAQITRVFSKKLEVYLGVENASNFIQKNMIINAETPNNNFDASMIWGPTIGRMFYTGLRYVL